MPRPKTFPAEKCPPQAPSRCVVPLRLRPLRMARLAIECLVRLTVRTDTPCTRLLRSLHCAATHGSVIDSARRFALDGVCVAASSSLHWYRVSSFLLNPIQAFRKHDAHPEGCPATLSLTLAHSLTALCSGSIAFTAQPSALTSFGGIGAARLGHTLAAVAVLRSLASASTAHRHRQSTKSPLNHDFAEILSQKNSGIDERNRNRTCVSVRSRTSASSPHNGKIALHIPQI